LTAQLLKDGAIRNFEEEINLPSGEVKTVLTSIQYIYIEDQDAIISNFIDISERVRAERQIRQLTIDLTTAEQEERYRISQMLHDDLQQRIFAVKMQLENSAETLKSGDLGSVDGEFAKLDVWLAEAINITRQLSADLSPLSLKGEKLADVLLWLASQMKEQYGLNVKVDADEVQASLDNNLQLILFHAVRELLFNVVKHAGTLEAKLTLRQVGEDLIRVIVSDNGVGFDPGILTEKGNPAHGLVGLNQRLGLFGCTLEVDSAPERGARLAIDCPIRGAGRPL
jgi:signal transduction histidine kinase